MTTIQDHEPWLLELEAIANLRGQVAVDVGANTGQWATWLAHRFLRVVAYEPDPRAYEKLDEELEDLLNVIIVPAAVGAFNGSVELHMFTESSHTSFIPPHDPQFKPWRSKGRGQVLVAPQLMLDNHLKFKAMSLDFVKVDVEGAEHEVLKGAEGLMAEQRPQWLIEIHTKETRSMCQALLEKHKYDVGWIAHPHTPEIGHGWLITRRKDDN